MKNGSVQHYRYLALLANVDASFASVDLGPAFRIQRWSAKRLIGLLSDLESLPRHEIEFRIDLHHSCLDEEGKAAYVVTSAFRAAPDDGEGLPPSHRTRELDAALEETVALLRLFKDGGVDVVASYVYQVQDRVAELVSSTTSFDTIGYDPYVLAGDEVRSLNEFLRRWRLPFPLPYLRLAHQQFEQSYWASATALQFLSLMIALEVLFNPGPQELRYRISREVAIVLGDTPGEAESIFRSVQSLYDKRSLLVHSGKAETLTADDVKLLRDYIRRSIVALAGLGIPKDEMVSEINRLGFGQKLTRRSAG